MSSLKNYKNILSSFSAQYGGEFIVNKDFGIESINFSAFQNDLWTAIQASYECILNLNLEFQAAGGQGVDPRIVVVNRQTKNATSTIYSGVDIIALDIDLCTTLWSIAASFSKVIPNLTGNIDLDRSIEGVVENSATIDPTGLGFGLADLDISYEENASRLRLGIFVASIRWIVHHELAHIWNGHILYLKYLKDNNAESSEISRVKFAFEIDADTRASNGIVNDFQSPRIRSNIIMADDEMANKIMFEAFFFSLIGIFAAFHIYVVRESLDPNLDIIDHPRSNVRVLALINALEIKLEGFSRGSSLEQLNMPSYTKVIYLIYINIVNIVYHNDFVAIESTANQELSFTREEFEDTWNQIGPHLCKYMRGLRLPGPYIDGVQTGFFS